MATIDSLLSPVTEEDELMALSDGLRQRKRAGDFFGMSTIPELAQMGQQQGQDVMAAAQAQGGLRKALADRTSREEQAEAGRLANRENYEYQQGELNARQERGFEEDRNTRALEQDAIMPIDFITPDGDIVQGRMQGGMLVDGVGMPLPKGSKRYSSRGGNKPGATLLQGYIKSIGLDEQISGLDTLVDDLPDEAKEQLNNTTGDVLLDISKKVIPGTAADWAARNSLYTHPKAQQTMEKFARLESEVLNLISGKQITGLEADKVNKWSPNYPGLNLEQRVRRAKNLQERIQQEMGSFESYYEDWSLRGQQSAPSGGTDYNSLTDAELEAKIREGG